MPRASSTREAKRTVSRLHRVKVQLPRSSTGRACILALGYSKNAEPTSASRLPSSLLASTRLYSPLPASTRLYSPLFACIRRVTRATFRRPVSATLTRAPIHRSSSSRRRSDRVSLSFRSRFPLVSLWFRPQLRIIVAKVADRRQPRCSRSDSEERERETASRRSR